MKLQKTIKDEVQLTGKGLFGGQDATVTFRPAAEDTGIVFVRTDVVSAVRIPATAPSIAERSRRTSIKKGDVSIETVEHCLAAVRALEIDNLTIDVSGPELPAPDCSSAGFLTCLKQAGIVEQKNPRKEFVIQKAVSVSAGDATIYALPDSDGELNITYDLDYSGYPAIGRQVFSYRLTPESSSSTRTGPSRTPIVFPTSASGTRSWT